jgi:probable addiction module antidote protein
MEYVELPDGFALYDSADYINNAEDAAAYLKACFDEAGDDASFIAHALGVVARSGNM